MDPAVKAFSSELNVLLECKPPISKAKMTSVTKAAIKAVKFYKHVVLGVEKFIQKCGSEFKVPGLYVIDSIVRQSRHQFGAEKDVFAMRFARNFNITFQNLFKCPSEEKSKIVRVLNLWQKNNVFSSEVIQPLLDMANPNHAIHQSANTAVDTPTKKQEPASGWTGWSNDVGGSQLEGDFALRAMTQLLQQTQQASVTSLLQPSGTMMTQSLAESNLLLQLQQLTTLLAQQQQGSLKPAEQDNTVKFNKKLLDFDYSDEEEEDDKRDDDQQQPQHQLSQDNTSLAVSMAQNLLSNPDLLRQLQQMQQTIQQTEALKSELNLQELLSKQRQWQTDDVVQQALASSQAQQSQGPLQPPPPFDMTQFSSMLAPPASTLPLPVTAASMSPVPTLVPPPLLPATLSSPLVVLSSSPRVVTPVVTSEEFPVIDLEESMSVPETRDTDDVVEQLTSDREDEKMNDVDRGQEARDERARSPVIRRKERSRSPSQSRSRKRSRRSRSRSRSPRRTRRSRSRSGSRTHNRHKRERRSRSKEREREREREKEREREREREKEREKERKKRGLPPFIKDHLLVCSTTLWLGHVSKLVSEEDLADTFGEFGDIVAIDLIPPRGCAFVCMNRRQDAYRALQKLKNLKLQGKTITMAWAPGKGVKGKDYKDYWDADLGVSYIPYERVPKDVDFDALEEGGMVDEETMSEELKEKQKAGEREKLKAVKEGEAKASGLEASSEAPASKSAVLTSELQPKPSQVPPPVMPPMMPPMVPPPQFGMPPMVSSQPMMVPMPVGVPPPLMVPPVGQPQMMGQTLPMMGSMPPPFGICPPTTTSTTVIPVMPPTSDAGGQQDKMGGDSTPTDEARNELQDAAGDQGSKTEVASPLSLTSDAQTTTTESLAISTPILSDVLDPHSSIPLPPGSAPSSSTAAVATSASMTTAMTSAMSTLPSVMGVPPPLTSTLSVMQNPITSHSTVASMGGMPPLYQPFMHPPPHIFRPPAPGFGMMPPMGMNMGNPNVVNPGMAPMHPGMGFGTGGVRMSAIPNMMNATGHGMMAMMGPRINQIRTSSVPQLMPGGPPSMLNVRPGMNLGMELSAVSQASDTSASPSKKESNRSGVSRWDRGDDTGPSELALNNSGDVDMRTPTSRAPPMSVPSPGNGSVGGGDQSMADRLFQGTNMSPRSRASAGLSQHPLERPVGMGNGRPPMLMRHLGERDSMSGPGPRPTLMGMPRMGGGERMPSPVDRQGTSIEARLSRLADMGDVGPPCLQRSVVDSERPASLMRPPLFQGRGMPSPVGGLMVGRFTGPHGEGPPRLSGPSQHMGPPNMGPRPAFGRFPGSGGMHHLPNDGPRFHGGRFPGIPPRGPPPFAGEDREFVRHPGMRPDLMERDFRDFREDRGDDFSGLRDMNGDRFLDDFEFRRGPLRGRDDLRDRDMWRNRDKVDLFDREFEPNFRNRFRLDRRLERDERPRMSHDFRREEERFHGGWEHEGRERGSSTDERDRGRDSDRSCGDHSRGRRKSSMGELKSEDEQVQGSSKNEADLRRNAIEAISTDGDDALPFPAQPSVCENLLESSTESGANGGADIPNNGEKDPEDVKEKKSVDCESS